MLTLKSLKRSAGASTLQLALLCLEDKDGENGRKTKHRRAETGTVKRILRIHYEFVPAIKTQVIDYLGDAFAHSLQ